MKSKPTFESVKLKIERADHHIDDLERQLAAFTWQNFDASVSYANDERLDITITVLPPPPAIALTIGDVVHNLHTALNHLVWEFIGYDCGKQDRYLKFPFGRDRASFEGCCGGIVGASQQAKDTLKATQAFPGGSGQVLYFLHDLDNADKHETLTPIVHTPTIDELVLVSNGGKVRRLLSDLYGGSAALGLGETFTIDGAPAGSFLAFKNNAPISPHILFGKVEFVENELILPTIARLRDAVANTIKIVARSIV